MTTAQVVFHEKVKFYVKFKLIVPYNPLEGRAKYSVADPDSESGRVN